MKFKILLYSHWQVFLLVLFLSCRKTFYQWDFPPSFFFTFKSLIQFFFFLRANRLYSVMLTYFLK